MESFTLLADLEKAPGIRTGGTAGCRLTSEESSISSPQFQASEMPGSAVQRVLLKICEEGKEVCAGLSGAITSDTAHGAADRPGQPPQGGAQQRPWEPPGNGPRCSSLVGSLQNRESPYVTQCILPVLRPPAFQSEDKHPRIPTLNLSPRYNFCYCSSHEQNSLL